MVWFILKISLAVLVLQMEVQEREFCGFDFLRR